METVVLDLNTSRHQQVTAQFGDGKQAFALKDGATLSDLAEYIDVLALAHGGWPQSIQITFGIGKAKSVPTQNQLSH